MNRLDSTTCDFLYFARLMHTRISELAEAEYERKPQQAEKVFEKQVEGLRSNTVRMLRLGTKISLPRYVKGNDRAFPFLDWETTVDEYINEVADDVLEAKSIPVGMIIEELNQWVSDFWSESDE